uniref:Uncharacterized protein n=1 Tax=Molossus molossus TaxID=27622 RepID=A0A7J8BYJ6_MOLMO|nr:hypothetical protein HJG59_010059 [Molossus molossus]
MEKGNETYMGILTTPLFHFTRGTLGNLHCSEPFRDSRGPSVPAMRSFKMWPLTVSLASLSLTDSDAPSFVFPLCAFARAVPAAGRAPPLSVLGHSPVTGSKSSVCFNPHPSIPSTSSLPRESLVPSLGDLLTLIYTPLSKDPPC